MISSTRERCLTFNLVCEAQRFLCNIGPLEPPPCAVADVQYFYPLLLLQYSVYCPVNMRLVPVKQMPELVALRCHRAAARLFFEAENRLPEAAIPFQGRVGMLGVDLPVQMGEITSGAGGKINQVCHARLRSLRKTPSL